MTHIPLTSLVSSTDILNRSFNAIYTILMFTRFFPPDFIFSNTKERKCLEYSTQASSEGG